MYCVFSVCGEWFCCGFACVFSFVGWVVFSGVGDVPVYIAGVDVYLG